MDFIIGLLQGASWIGVILLIILIAAAALLVVKSRWKSAKGFEVLVVSGTRKGVQVYQGGGAFVSPFQEHGKFNTTVLTLSSNGKETPTKPKIPVVIDWTAQIRPDDSSDAQLIRAYKDFYGTQKTIHGNFWGLFPFSALLIAPFFYVGYCLINIFISLSNHRHINVA